MTGVIVGRRGEVFPVAEQEVFVGPLVMARLDAIAQEQADADAAEHTIEVSA